MISVNLPPAGPMRQGKARGLTGVSTLGFSWERRGRILTTEKGYRHLRCAAEPVPFFAQSLFFVAVT